MEQTQLADEQIQAINKAFQAVADVVCELWDKIIELFRATAKALSEMLKFIHVGCRRQQIFRGLRRRLIPRRIAWWISNIIPKRLLLMI